MNGVTTLIEIVSRLLLLVETHGLSNVLIILMEVVLIGIIIYLLRKASKSNSSVINLHGAFQDKLVELQEKRISDIKEVIEKFYELSTEIEISLKSVHDCLRNLNGTGDDSSKECTSGNEEES